MPGPAGELKCSSRQDPLAVAGEGIEIKERKGEEKKGKEGKKEGERGRLHIHRSFQKIGACVLCCNFGIKSFLTVIVGYLLNISFQLKSMKRQISGCQES